jgi:hypothetical protein
VDRDQRWNEMKAKLDENSKTFMHRTIVSKPDKKTQLEGKY